MPDLNIPIKRLDSDAIVPSLGTAGAAAVDLCALTAGWLPPSQSRIIDIGLAFEIPFGYVGLVCSRSGLAAKNAVFVMNAPGLIDSDYRGPVKLIVHNAGPSVFYYRAGDRLAQMMFIRHEHVVFSEADELSETARGEGGLGSTGVAA